MWSIRNIGSAPCSHHHSFSTTPSAYPSCSSLSLQLLLSFWVRAWRTNLKHSGLIWRCLWEEAEKDRTQGSNPRCLPNSWFPFWPCVYFLNVLSYILSWTGVGTKNIWHSHSSLINTIIIHVVDVKCMMLLFPISFRRMPVHSCLLHNKHGQARDLYTDTFPILLCSCGILLFLFFPHSWTEWMWSMQFLSN